MSDAVNVEEDEDYIYVTIPYDEDAKAALKEKFRAMWDPDERRWYISAHKYDLSDVEKEVKLHFPRAFR